MTRTLLVIWGLLLIPWLPFAMMSLMAFDGGDTWGIRLGIAAVWSFGPAVIAAFALLHRSNKFVFLPFGSLFLFVIATVFGS